jgi:hypothetical protein
MSLHTAAKHLASKGRNGDSTLVHMSPGEVKSLQGLALAHGGSLTINPDTGLVEASFLKNLLPMIAGAALSPFITPMGAAAVVGGFEGIRSKDLGKGLLAGLGAFGGGNLAAGLSATAPTATGITAGAAPTATTAVAPGALGSTANMAGASNALASGTSLAAPTASSFGSIAAPSAGSTLGSIAVPTGASAAAPGMAASEIAKYGMYAAAPVLGGAMEPVPIPGQEKREYGEDAFLSPDFQGYTPRRPNPYYRPTGLGYAAQGGSTYDIMMAAGGSFDDEPMGDDAAMAAGGSIGGYSDGGRMLKGPGDGMSDSIPAMIGKRQPARLADGEFVVPADVVSHLGNGSTDAGAKHLYSMMDKVRKARTGTKKQGKQIKPQKFMPA